MNSFFRIAALSFICLALPLSAQQQTKQNQSEPVSTQNFGSVSFDFKNADLRNVLRIFATKADVNIIAGPDVTGTVTMRLRNVPWEKALGLILDVNGYGFQRDANIIKVLTKAEMSRQPTQTQVYFLNYAEANKLEKSVSQLLSKEGKVRTDKRSNTLIVTDLPQYLAQIAPVVQRLDQQTPQVLVQSMVVETNAEVDENIGVNWRFLDGYGVRVQGLSATYTDTSSSSRTFTSTKILSTFISTTRTFTATRIRTSTGTSSGAAPFSPINTFTNTLSTSLTNGETGSQGLLQSLLDTNTLLRRPAHEYTQTATLSADTLEIVLSFLENTTDSKILSAPEVLTTNNQTARILVGEQYPLANYVFNDDTGTLEVQGFTYIDIGIKLFVTPKISPDGYVTLDVKPEIKTRGASVPFAGSTGTVVPIINTQEVEVQAVVKDRETLVIGGLITDNEKDSVVKVPFFGDLPIIGPRLFQDKSIEKDRRNLFVFITPIIVTSKNANEVAEIRRKIINKHSNGIPKKEQSYWSDFDEEGNAREIDLDTDNVYTGQMGTGF